MAQHRPENPCCPLAERQDQGYPHQRQFEAGKTDPKLTTVGKSMRALERAGITFIRPDAEAGPVVRLKDGASGRDGGSMSDGSQVKRLGLHERPMASNVAKADAVNDEHLRQLIARLDAAGDTEAADTIAYLVRSSGGKL